ncbi:MAG: hypothetical protein JWO09_1292 [Bacteroidetes bacterium]|nr:hypothetical protein [Bacteroidota bacterium]
MALPSKNTDLYRRLRFYGFGFVLGCLAVSIIFKGRGCKLPGSAKLEELSYQKLELSVHGECRMKCRNITEAEIRDVLKTGKINYDKSNVHDKPFGTYAVEGNTADGQNVRIVIADCDTVSRVVTAIDLRMEKDSCDCK